MPPEKAESAESNKTQRSAASGLLLHGLPMSHKMDAMIIWVKVKYFLNKILKITFRLC